MNLEPTVLFSALANDTRLRCLMLLLHHDELCVCQLTHAIGASQPHISRHLAQLREVGLVVDRRAGLWVFYRINPELSDWAQAVLRVAAVGIRRDPPYANDEQALATIPNRPAAARCA